MPANPNTHHTNYLQIKGNNTEAVKFAQNADKTLNFKPGANVSISATSGEITISSTDTNTATAADNILDGSNSGTQITYKPYTSQQSKLSFDTSTTNPTRTDRLNLNGHLHATKLYSGGKEVLTSHQDISGKLDKTTYEWNKEFRASRNGAISLGRYYIYDTQLTFDISSTTSDSINGKLVIAAQNGVIQQAKVFGDATGVLVSKMVIYQSAIVNNRSWVEVFCNFDGWSKNKVHIYGVALESATVTNQMSSVTFTNGVPSPITNGDSKWSGTIDNDLSVKQNKLTAGSNITISGNTISATDTNTSHNHSAGIGLVGSGNAGTGSGTYNYKAKLRSETALTVDSVASPTAFERVYPVAIDKSGYLAVNVPWSIITYKAGTGLELSGTTFSAKLNSTTSLGTIGTTSKLYAVGVDANGKLCVNVPWTDTNTTYSAGAGLKLSNGVFSVSTGYATNGKNYGIEADVNGHLYVNVPWTDTNTDTGATNVTVTGNGNAITNASYDSSSRNITFTKETTFLTSHQTLPIKSASLSSDKTTLTLTL